MLISLLVAFQCRVIDRRNSSLDGSDHDCHPSSPDDVATAVAAAVVVQAQKEDRNHD